MLPLKAKVGGGGRGGTANGSLSHGTKNLLDQKRTLFFSPVRPPLFASRADLYIAPPPISQLFIAAVPCFLREPKKKANGQGFKDDFGQILATQSGVTASRFSLGQGFELGESYPSYPGPMP